MRFKRRDRKNFRLKKVWKTALTGVGALSAVFWLTACTEETVQDAQATNSPYMAAGSQSMEEAPVIDYVVPQVLPNILADRHGYSAGDVKKAVIRGKQLPETFSLVNAKTGEIVYSGPVEQTGYDAELKLYRGEADFSQVDKQGSYYLKCDILGQSYDFEIRERFYQDLFQEGYGEFLEACEDNSLSVPQAVRILETYEWYGGLFPDKNRNDTPDVLEKLQGWVSHMEETGVEAKQEMLYAAFLAKFSYNYKKFNYQYATDCLQRAATVFSQAQTGAGKNGDSFFALTELYRATSLNTYHSQIAEYKKMFVNSCTYLDDAGYICGRMTYLMTRQKVDTELCAAFMEQIMDRGEEISKQYRDMESLSKTGDKVSADMLKHARELSCANYILNNYQYTNIIQNFLHYLMGRNQEAVSFYEGDEDRSSYLLLLAQIAANHEKDAGTK